MQQATASAVLVARGLRKSYKNVTAVDGIDLDLARGECLALLGPNGAGKTTTVEMLDGLLAPDAGTIEVCGMQLATQRLQIMERIGVLLQETNLYKRFTVKETLELFASFYEKQTLEPEAVMERMQLTEKARTQLRHLSGGQKQRVYIGCSLINDPELLFLDEPTTGLDPQARRSIWDLLATLKSEGRSILLTTHYMDEAEQLADRVAIVDRGKIIVQGTPRQLIHEICGEQVIWAQARRKGGDSLAAAQLRQMLGARLPWLSTAIETGGGLEVTTTAAARHVAELTLAADAAGLELTGLAMRSSTLEDVFLKLTGRSMRDG